MIRDLWTCIREGFWDWFDGFFQVDPMPDYSNPRDLPPEEYWDDDEYPHASEELLDELVNTYVPGSPSVYNTIPSTGLSNSAAERWRGDHEAQREMEAWAEILRKAAEK